MLTLVLGGVRSGKSAFAAERARQVGGPVTCLATGIAGDEEMERRITAHRRARPASWRLVEEPLAPAAALPAGTGTLLFESVDSWAANRLEACGGSNGSGDEGLLADLESELRAVEGGCRHLVAVSSETGLSLLPPTASGRAFMDLLGSLNQALAERAAAAYLVVAGIAIPLHAHRLKV